MALMWLLGRVLGSLAGGDGRGFLGTLAYMERLQLVAMELPGLLAHEVVVSPCLITRKLQMKTTFCLDFITFFI